MAVAQITQRVTEQIESKGFLRMVTDEHPGIRFTAKELAVLDQLCKGYTDKDIAWELYVAPRTVSFHLTNMRQKAGVHSRTALLMVAIKAGMIKIDSGLQLCLPVTLTLRQIQVLQLAGEHSRQAASALGIAKHTVDYNWGRIYAALQVCNRPQALVRAFQLGLITLPSSSD